MDNTFLYDDLKLKTKQSFSALQSFKYLKIGQNCIKVCIVYAALLHIGTEFTEPLNKVHY